MSLALVETVRAVITTVPGDPFAEVFENEPSQTLVGIGIIDHLLQFLPFKKAPTFNLLKIDVQFGDRNP